MPMLAVVALAAGATAATMAAGVALASAVTYVGVGMSVVGAVTKNENFMKVGAVMGLAGGVMSVAGIGTAAGATTATGVTSVASTETALEAAAFDQAMAAQGAAEMATNAADPYFSAAQAGDAASSMAAPVADAANSATTYPVSMPPAVEPVAPATPTAPADGLLNSSQSMVQAPSMSVDSMADQAAKSIATPDPSITATPPPPPSGISAWWATQSQPAKEMWMKAAAQGVGSMFQGWSEEQKLALQREIANQNQGNVDTKQANLNAQPTVSFRPVNGYPQRTGLLGSSIAKVGG